MRFLGGLLLHVGRVVVGLLAVVGVIAAIVVGGIWYLRQPAPEDPIAEALRQRPVAAAETPAPAPDPSVRVVTPPAPERPAEPVTPAPPPPPPRIDSIAKIDQATRDFFDNVVYLGETGTARNPQSCDDVFDWMLWVSLLHNYRSVITRDQSSLSETLGFIFTFGASQLVQPGNERWTIFTGEMDGRYITFTLGAPRYDSSADKVGPQTRMTLYRMDARRVGLVEQAPLDAPPARRPAKRPPKIQKVYLVCGAKT